MSVIAAGVSTPSSLAGARTRLVRAGEGARWRNGAERDRMGVTSDTAGIVPIRGAGAQAERPPVGPGWPCRCVPWVAAIGLRAGRA